ncbi:hypothetical protein EIP91_005582 [Steccherinum ochraceum]|uniref:Cytochrome P450-dit2 n=1 Tax=Steccherinum ochraceum TaxID=92696 RepID=A0A4R0R719_9APHY|nr:hypothetical protein EIP91_005582 [Steccherinum ochraceum]
MHKLSQPQMHHLLPTFSDAHSTVLFGVAVLSILLAIRGILRSIRESNNALPLPPGPKPLPVVGNLLDMPKDWPWHAFQAWCEKYGDVLFLKLPKASLLVLGSFEAATDLLEKRSAIYSDKSTTEMMKLMRWEWSMAIMPYGPTWREHRRIAHQYLNYDAVKQYRTLQLEEIRACLSRMLETPLHAKEHIHQAVTGIITRMVYGMRLKSMDDEYIELAETATRGFAQALIPGAYFVDILPILRYIPCWVPGVKGRKLAEEYKPFVLGMRDMPFDEVKEKINRGDAEPSMAASLVTKLQEEYKTTNLTFEQDGTARCVAGQLYAAAADTTNASSLVFLLAMALHPEVQRKAQAELDQKVLGTKRLPDFDDLPELVYIEAITLEVLRWLPVAPIGATHRVMEDDEYKGYRIPKGTVVMANGWQILHKPEDYPDPEAFKPERFIKYGKINTDVRDPSTVAFGFGRRYITLSLSQRRRHLAYNSLVMIIASLLHVFDIAPGVDESGKPIKLTTEPKPGLIITVKDCPKSFTPRSTNAARIVREGTEDLVN